ncbi:hypothetical protein AB0K25_12955 [Micromonospora sp. NPDC049257]|uniref:hypothetical protein n=1 Tax=Micromonospora sp. NPDC049257 TaxID=3155771 RepID=UPI003415FECE
MSPSNATFVDALELRAIVLDECSVKRGDADHDKPGEVASTITIEPTYDGNGKLLTYSINAHHTFNNSEGQVVVNIDVSMAALYDVHGELEPSEEEIESFGSTSALVHVTPFFREFLATMTNRLGMPVFYLPMLKVRKARAGKQDAK